MFKISFSKIISLFLLVGLIVGAFYTPQTFAKDLNKNKVSIIMIHSVNKVPKKDNQSLWNESLSVDNFEKLLISLKDKKMHSITLEELYNGTYGPNSVVLTFDDGYADFYYFAVPLMKKYGFTGVNGVITSMIGSNNYMTAEQIKEVSKSGFDIVSHSVNHKEMNTLSEKDQTFELTKSREILEKLTGKKINTFIFPVGRYNDTSLVVLKKLGYKLAFTTKQGKYYDGNNKLSINRMRLDNRNTISYFVENIQKY